MREIASEKLQSQGLEDYKVETLLQDLEIADDLDQLVRGKGFGRDWDITTARIVQILRSQQSLAKYADIHTRSKSK